MKKFCFLIGGLGNVFFQLVHTSYPSKNIAYSDFFLKKSVRKFFKQSNHPNFNKALFGVDTKIHVLPLMILLFDILIFKITKKTLFSKLDCNLGFSTPVLYEFIYLGYFQKCIPEGSNSIGHISNFLDQNHKNVLGLDDNLVVHFRKGDFSILGIDLPESYYIDIIEKFKNKFKFDLVTIVTDDLRSSAELETQARRKFGDVFKFTHISSNVVDDFMLLRSSKYLIGSSSTFSLAAALLNKNLVAVHFHYSTIDTYTTFNRTCEIVN